MEIQRPNPEKLLDELRQEEKKEGSGRLKIFFGYAAGVGKTYSMLKAARKLKYAGTDVVLGYVEPHARPETLRLMNGFETVSVKVTEYHGLQLKEMDIDAILARKPEVVLVDEYAHTNAPECRHRKRYQDVEELLKAGIDVYTTVNVQHLESLCDIVASVTGILVRERIPDRAFELADEVQLVDVEPAELISRLKEGKIYHQEQALRALENFFTEEKLTALREIALRRMADRVNRISEREKKRNGKEYFTEEKILAGISSSPSNPKIIRAAARMAQAFGGTFTGLYVEAVPRARMKAEDRKRLEENIRLAEQLGAEIETICGEDVPFLIAEYARTSGISKIVAGRSYTRRGVLKKSTFTDRLAMFAPNIDIYIIPDSRPGYLRSPSQMKYPGGLSAPAVLKGVLIFLFGIMIGVCFYVQEPATLTFLFAAGFLTGFLILKMRIQERELAKTVYRTRLLMDTNQRLQSEKDLEGIGRVMSMQLGKILDCSVVYYGKENGQPREPVVYDEKGEVSGREELTGTNERAVAEWVFKNRKRAGAGTDTLGSAACYYLAIRNQSEVFGVVGIEMKPGETLGAFENNVIFAVLAETAMAMEKETLRRNPLDKKEETGDNEEKFPAMPGKERKL